MDDSDFIKMAQRLRPRTVAEIAEKLNNCISNNIMNQIEMFLGTFQFTQDCKKEWFYDYGGMEAVKRWRGFHGHEDIEKKNFPKAYNFKQDCLYYLDNYEQSRRLNSESEFIQNEDVQEAEIISVCIPPSPLERIAEAVEHIDAKMPEIPPEPAPNTQAPEADVLQPSDLLFVSAIAGYYPLFSSHYSKLKKAQFIESNGTGLHWKKSKQSLAEYFDAIKPKDKSHNWKILETTFNVLNLRQAASQNGDAFKGKKSKDFMELERIITVL
jgi:hypothetical protein